MSPNYLSVVIIVTHLHPDAVVDTEPEEQQGTQEQSLKESIQRPWKPAVHQEGQREKRI